MTITLVMLTCNRADMLAQTMAHNLRKAGGHIDELVWVDNGSTDGAHDIMRAYAPDVCVLNKSNLGVSKGYNRGFALATGDYVVITDDDMLMPDGWIATFRTYLTMIPQTGVACIFHQPSPITFTRTLEVNGLSVHPCYPFGRRIVSRDLLVRKIGYLREDFGLYGHEDIEWSRRAVRVCREYGLLTYAIPGLRAEHLGDASRDPRDYRAFKEAEGQDPRKREILLRCRRERFKYFNPYA